MPSEKKLDRGVAPRPLAPPAAPIPRVAAPARVVAAENSDLRPLRDVSFLPDRPAATLHKALLKRIVSCYRSPVVRTYAKFRFVILRQRFLEEVGQYLPTEGRILDIGCGFGLFGLYFAGSYAGRQIAGYDLNQKRIAMARLAAREARIPNAHFFHGNALELPTAVTFDGIYALDLIHHLPREAVPGFLTGLHERLRSPGVLVIKDVTNRPNYKRWFTLALDRAMVGLREPIHYWPVVDLRDELIRVGFRVYTHVIHDYLPYPHVLYICYR